MRNFIFFIFSIAMWMFFLFICGVWALVQIAVYPIIFVIEWLENKFPRNRRNSDQTCGNSGINNS